MTKEQVQINTEDVRTCTPCIAYMVEGLKNRKKQLLATIKEITIGGKPVLLKSDEHAHYFSTTLQFDINQEVKVCIDNGNQWKVYSRFGDMDMDWHLTEYVIDAETLKLI